MRVPEYLTADHRRLHQLLERAASRSTTASSSKLAGAFYATR